MPEKLHDGSRWDGDAVVDSDGAAVTMYSADDSNDCIAISSDDDRNCACAFHEDVHAVLSRAGHCPNSSERANELLKALLCGLEAIDDNCVYTESTEVAPSSKFPYGHAVERYLSMSDVLSNELEAIRVYLREKGLMP